jgi:hypothetical protein
VLWNYQLLKKEYVPERDSLDANSYKTDLASAKVKEANHGQKHCIRY